jgi:hypothetical protein
MNRLDISILETTFRGYPRTQKCSWALHYNIAFACKSFDSPEFLADEIRDAKAYFQLPQHFCSVGVWGQFEDIAVRSDNEIGLGPRRVWRVHAQANVTRDQLWDAWARTKVVFDFHKFAEPVWLKANAAFRCQHMENVEARWGTPLRSSLTTTFCYSGAESSWSIETRMTADRPV